MQAGYSFYFRTLRPQSLPWNRRHWLRNSRLGQRSG